MLPSWSWRANPGTGKLTMAPDEADVDELILFADNESSLYNQKKSIIANIKRRLKNGTYNHLLAPKLWQYWTDEAAKKYVKEFGTDSDFRVSDPGVRREAARQLADREIEYIKQGEYGP